MANRTAELLLCAARAAGVITFLDTVWDDTGRWMEILAPCLPLMLIILFPSCLKAAAGPDWTTPQKLHALLERGVRTVGLKMGVDGCSGDVLAKVK